MKRTLSIFFGVSASLLVPLAVFAAAINVTEDFGIILPSDSSTYTIKAGSTLNTVTVSGSAFTLSLDPQDQTTISASGKQNLTNDANIQTICESDQSKAVFAVATTGSSMTVTITPSGTCSTATATATGGGSGGGSGGGGSSSGGSSSATPFTPATPATPVTPATSTTAITTIPATPATPATQATPATPPVSAVSSSMASGIVITRALVLGSRGNDVKTLQQFLASDKSIYPEGIVSSYFGPKTLAAVKRFQEKYGIAKKGDPGYGNVGPKTRAKLKGFSNIPSPLPASSSTPSVEELQAQLKTLQDMLKKLQQK